MGDKGEWWRVWIQLWYIWCIVRAFANATMYHHHNNKWMNKWINK
jgi:hypothetical protein